MHRFTHLVYPYKTCNYAYGFVSNIVGTEALFWKESNLPTLTYKVTSTLYVMR